MSHRQGGDMLDSRIQSLGMKILRDGADERL